MSTITKIKEITIEDYLKSLTSKEVNELFEKISSDFITPKKRITRREKIETIIADALTSFMINIITFTDAEVKQFNDLIEGKSIKNISPKFTNNSFVLKIDDQYIIPNEIKEMYTSELITKAQESKEILVLSYYLEVNGVLEINQLIKLMKASGISITKKKIIDYSKENGYIIKKDLIYINQLAVLIDQDLNIHHLKKENAYREFVIEEMIATQLEMEEENYEDKIKAILSKKTKNKQTLLCDASIIYNMIGVGYDYQQNIVEFLESQKIKLNESEQEKLMTLADEIYWYYPSWELNGYCEAELSEDEFEDEVFEDLSPKEQVEAYINVYLTLNGVMPIDKLLEILTINHKLNITKNDLIKIASKVEETTIFNNYLCIEGAEEIIDEIMPIKNMLNQYKVIEDIDEIIDEIWSITNRIVDLGLEYNLDEEVASGLEQIMRMGGIDEEILEAFLEDNDYKLSPKKQKELLKELSLIQKDVRVWELNGFKKSELTRLNKKVKIGRNDKCSCGSGKKYKQCCGK